MELVFDNIRNGIVIKDLKAFYYIILNDSEKWIEVANDILRPEINQSNLIHYLLFLARNKKRLIKINLNNVFWESVEKNELNNIVIALKNISKLLKENEMLAYDSFKIQLSNDQYTLNINSMVISKKGEKLLSLIINNLYKPIDKILPIFIQQLILNFGKIDTFSYSEDIKKILKETITNFGLEENIYIE